MGRCTKLREAQYAYAFKKFIGNQTRVRVPGDFREFYLALARGVYGESAIYPDYLQGLIDHLLHESGDGQRIVVDIPPRHLKTTTILICYIYTVLTRRYTKQMFTTYSDDLATEASQQYDALWNAWTSVSPGLMRKKWFNSNVVFFGSIKGGLTGRGANWNVTLDDPIRNREDAYSQQIKDAIWSSYTSSLLTRIEGLSCNILVNGTRWVSDDPQGRCIAMGYRHIHYPAISEDGRALAPTLRPIDFLLQQQENLGGPQSYDWLALYQGEPPDTRLGIFKREIRRQAKRDERCKIVRVGYGIDLSYSTGKASDYCAFAKIEQWSDGTFDMFGFVVHSQVTEFFDRVRPIAGNEPLCWYVSSSEFAFASEISMAHNVFVRPKKSFGKLGNVQFLSAAWNQGRVLVPDDWRDDMKQGTALAQILSFTGKEGDKDDFPDAASAAFDDLTLRRMG